MLYVVYIVYKGNIRIIRITRILRIRRISQEYGRVFKGLQSLPRQFLSYSNSQNIIKVNLLGNYSTSYYYVVNFNLHYLYTQPINEPIIVPATRFRYILTATSKIQFFIALLSISALNYQLLNPYILSLLFIFNILQTYILWAFLLLLSV